MCKMEFRCNQIMTFICDFFHYMFSLRAYLLTDSGKTDSKDFKIYSAQS